RRCFLITRSFLTPRSGGGRKPSFRKLGPVWRLARKMPAGCAMLTRRRRRWPPFAAARNILASRPMIFLTSWDLQLPRRRRQPPSGRSRALLGAIPLIIALCWIVRHGLDELSLLFLTTPRSLKRSARNFAENRTGNVRWSMPTLAGFRPC